MSRILITGASGNLGRAVVERLLDDDHHIITADRVQNTERPVENHKLESIAIDLMDEEASRKTVNSIIENGLDAAVLLVGGFNMGSIKETDLSSIDKMIKLNFNTAYNIVRPLLPYFLDRPQGGQFILIGARPPLNPEHGTHIVGYTLSKTLVFKLADLINVEGKGKNVTATMVVPSLIDTKPNREAMPDADHSSWVPPEIIADVIAFSLTDAGKMMREPILKVYNNS
jgi:NAD(P)-dependent dehydrogenase (short-subunit alcohol dehydrogenase family)